MTLDFAKSERSTLGLEWELQLIDKDTLNLRQCAESVLKEINSRHQGQKRLHKEMLLNTVEINSRPRRRVRECLEDMSEGIEMLAPVLEPMRVELASAGSHPFANPIYQKVTDSERYAKLVEHTQYWGRQMLLFGTHVHVGIEDRKKVLPILGFLLTHLGAVQALSASSPFWGGIDTGYCDNRAMVFQQLPTAGTPHLLREWEEFENYVEDVKRARIVDNFDEIRWDIRPAPKFGTIEVRVADASTNLLEVGALTALVHCLVEWGSRRIDAGEELPQLPAWYVDENKWRAARYGLDAMIIENSRGEERALREAIPVLLAELEPVAANLGCVEELGSWEKIVAVGVGYERQRAAQQLNGNLESVVELMRQEFRAGHPLDPSTVDLTVPGDHGVGVKTSS
ncbi:MAG: glutamate--cysteine ligase [Mobiluncus porci]|uniref:glutamate--cysteine ligase n=1 Tax=Mobiluncus porci TaxID=2652278 RepID=UPI0023F42F58|nr:glutamate--cysteine ligase [Mobiluncus porci]MDD7541566.1 glutamate--cysteine ligase [Mobiluncus porci]MDY5748551.1 glutamate--cysteine ligase [Mobiluncus porci]